MTMLYRTRLYARYTTPLYPFNVYAIHEGGELHERAGRDRVEQWIVPGPGDIAIPYEGGPLWCRSREAAVRAAIEELEGAAASIATLLDQLRQELLTTHEV